MDSFLLTKGQHKEHKLYNICKIYEDKHRGKCVSAGNGIPVYAKNFETVKKGVAAYDAAIKMDKEGYTDDRYEWQSDNITIMLLFGKYVSVTLHGFLIFLDEKNIDNYRSAVALYEKEASNHC